MFRLQTVLALIALGGATWLGCAGDDGGGATPGAGLPLDPAATTARAQSNSRLNLMNAAIVLDALGDSDVIASLPISGGEECAGGSDFETECTSVPLDFDLTEVVGDFADWLDENVFAAANIVDETSNSVTYQLSTSWLCGDELPDPDCVAIYADVPIRVRVTSPSEGNLDLEVLVGRHNPANLRLYQTEISVDVDLSALRSALVALAQAAGEDASAVPQMSGRVTASLTELTATHAVATVAFPTALQVTSQDGWSLNVGAANPAARLELDSVAETLVASLSIGTVDASIPADALFGAATCDFEGDCVDEPGPEGTLGLHLAGASGQVALDGNDETLAFTGLGLGAGSSTVSYNGSEIVRLDLNASARRVLDLALSAVEDRLSITVSPWADLQVSLDFRHAQALNDGEAYPDWLANEDLGISLSGSPDPSVDFVSGDTTVERFEVVVGTLELTSRVLGLTSSARAGECLWFDSEADAEHPFEAVLTGLCSE